MKNIELYTDGSLIKNGDIEVGSYGVVIKIKSDNIENEYSGLSFEENMTSNSLELLAVIRGLEKIDKTARVTIFTDSQYVISGSEGKLKEVTYAKHRSLWKKFSVISKLHEINFKWIKGHSGHKYNERCDTLAKEQVRSMSGVFKKESNAVLGEKLALSKEMTKKEEKCVVYKNVEITMENSIKFNLKNVKYGSVLKYKNIEKKIIKEGSFDNDYEIELKIAIDALRLLKDPCNVSFNCSSEYFIKSVNQWISNWSINNWKNKKKKDIKNIELWKEYFELSKKHIIRADYSDKPANEKYINPEKLNDSAELTSGKKVVELYVNGFAFEDEKLGGYAGELFFKNNRKEFSGGESSTAKERMEIKAILEGVNLIKMECHIRIHTNSEYILKNIKLLTEANWKDLDKRYIENIDLLESMHSMISKHNVEVVLSLFTENVNRENTARNIANSLKWINI